MSSDNLLSDITEGAAKGALDWSLEKIKDKEIVFFRK